MRSREEIETKTHRVVRCYPYNYSCPTRVISIQLCFLLLLIVNFVIPSYSAFLPPLKPSAFTISPPPTTTTAVESTLKQRVLDAAYTLHVPSQSTTCCQVLFRSTNSTIRGTIQTLFTTTVFWWILSTPFFWVYASDAIHLTSGPRYWTIQEQGTEQEKIIANTALMDYVVGTINTMQYDNTGGILFDPRDFYHIYRHWLDAQQQQHSSSLNDQHQQHKLASRSGVVESLHWLVRDVLQDPYSQYLTREELQAELSSKCWNGFLGLGALVESPTSTSSGMHQFLVPSSTTPSSEMLMIGLKHELTNTMTPIATTTSQSWLGIHQVQYLPVVTAITPNSPAERAGLTVGDRIVAVGNDSFLHSTSSQIEHRFKTKYNNAENYLEHPDLIIAKPVFATMSVLPDRTNELWTMMMTVDSTKTTTASTDNSVSSSRMIAPTLEREFVRAYRPTRLRLSTLAAEPQSPYQIASTMSGGDALVQYQLLNGQNSIFYPMSSSSSPVSSVHDQQSVGYIRLTRFSRASTAEFVQAVRILEKAGATSYIIDLRNNYGGVIQEAMLTASALLRDPHAVLCYTLNSRGGFTPHDVEEYVLDHRYPGYLLSHESELVTIHQVRQEHPELWDVNGQINSNAWSPMSSYASIHEQKQKHGLHLPSTTNTRRTLAQSNNNNIRSATTNYKTLPVLLSSFSTSSSSNLDPFQSLVAQKNLVLLVNEGTASSAEVFASALHDNGRTVALVGTKTYGKGLVQHTFPLPDGGGLRLTVAEYLTPSLQHVTHVGNAQYDRQTGDWMGGGIQPDFICDSKQGIPGNIGADLCVGMALDAITEADSMFVQSGMLTVERRGGVDDGSHVRRAVQMGIVRDDF